MRKQKKLSLIHISPTPVNPFISLAVSCPIAPKDAIIDRCKVKTDTAASASEIFPITWNKSRFCFLNTRIIVQVSL